MNLIVSILTLFIVFAFFLTVFKGVGLSVLFNWEALVIIFGGTVAGLLIGYPVERLKDTFNAVVNSFKRDLEGERTIENLLSVARLYRKSEIRSLERIANYIEDSFMRLGINLLINNHSSNDIRSIMEREATTRLLAMQSHQNVLKTAARLAPSLGLAGTVISLIKMFGNMTTAEAMMPLMALALMSTFYGVVISNLIFLPLQAKLKEVADLQELEMLKVIEGITAIHNGYHPLKIEEMLRGGLLEDSYLATTSHNTKGVLATDALMGGRA